MRLAARLPHSLYRALALGLALGCAAAVAAPAADAEQAAQMVQALRTGLARSFVLDKDLRLDPALRAAADEISAAHLARIGKLLPAWLEEERKQTTGGKAPAANELYFAVWARVLNELALWQIEPGDAGYETATLAVLRTAPRVCDLEGDSRAADYASRIQRIQAMPAAQRSAALATERRLLEHWGQPRTAPAPWPDPLPQDAAVALIKRGLADGKRPGLPLPPMLASVLLGQQKDYAAVHATSQCALQQWWLQESLRQGAAPAAVLNAFRYGTLISATERLAGMFDDAPAAGKAAARGTPPYPKLASRFAVTGATIMRVQLDAAGKPLQASVADRKIAVPGIRGVRPIAFENIFDGASLDYALKGNAYNKPGGTGPVSFQMVWTLPAAAQPTSGKPTGASQ